MDKPLIDFQGNLWYFVQQMNMLLDNQYQRDKIDFYQTREKVQEGKTIEFLKEHFGDDIDFSLYNKALKTAFNDAMCEISEVYQGEERGKIGVQYNGLCLLLVYGMELIKKIEMQKTRNLISIKQRQRFL